MMKAIEEKKDVSSTHKKTSFLKRKALVLKPAEPVIPVMRIPDLDLGPSAVTDSRKIYRAARIAKKPSFFLEAKIEHKSESKDTDLDVVMQASDSDEQSTDSSKRPKII